MNVVAEIKVRRDLWRMNRSHYGDEWVRWLLNAVDDVRPMLSVADLEYMIGQAKVNPNIDDNVRALIVVGLRSRLLSHPVYRLLKEFRDSESAQ